jgi:hypothetical protein
VSRVIRLLVVVPTYARSLETVMRCLNSVRSAVPQAHYGRTVVIDQNRPPLPLPDWVEVLHAEPGFPGPRRHQGALAAALDAGPADVFLFLDDDIELIDWSRFPRLVNPAGILARPDTGCVQVSLWRWGRTARIRLGDTSGGILVPVPAYFRMGGYGEDYLDDVELFARSLIAGFRNWRTHLLRSRHHFGPGGLESFLGGRRFGLRHRYHSRLEERYPGHLVRADYSWLGYRYVGKG